MAKGSSGRIVIEIDPGLKQELYNALDKEGMSLKAFFLGNVEEFLTEKGQLDMFNREEHAEEGASA